MLNLLGQEKPREKLLYQGPHYLSDSELLAIFYRTGIKGKSVTVLAAEHLDEQGSLRSLVDMSYAQAKTLPGMGLSKYASLQASLELGRRYLAQEIQQKSALDSLDKVVSYLQLQIRPYQYEVVLGLLLNTKNHLLACVELAHGGLGSAQLYPRTVVQQALGYNAAGLILAHNHPSGDPRPSQVDQDVTQSLKALLATLEVRLLDHIILGAGNHFSFAAEGLL